MKFVKKTVAALSAKLIMTVGLISLAACSSQQKLPEAGQKVSLKGTEQYVPVQKYDEAGKAIEYVGQENPYLAITGRIDKGSVLLYIEAKKAKRKGNLKTAKNKLNVITKNDTSLSGPWVMLGDIAFDEGKFKTAESHYQKAILINPKNINAYVVLAKVQRVLGSFHVAQNTLALALELWPDFPEAHLNLGILYDMYLNQPKKSQMHLEAYLFLTQYKNQKAMSWFSEVKNRTGIDTSFIDEKIKAVEKMSQSAIAEHIEED